MNLFVLSGLQNDVLYVDGLKIGITTKLSSATGNIASSFYYLLIYCKHLNQNQGSEEVSALVCS